MAQTTEYKNNYIKENYDRINLTVPKGWKNKIEAYAKQSGLSTNGFINSLIAEALSIPLAASSKSSEAARSKRRPAALNIPAQTLEDTVPSSKPVPSNTREDIDIVLL